MIRLTRHNSPFNIPLFLFSILEFSHLKLVVHGVYLQMLSTSKKFNSAHIQQHPTSPQILENKAKNNTFDEHLNYMRPSYLSTQGCNNNYCTEKREFSSRPKRILTKKLLLSSKLYTRAMAAGIMQNKVR